MRTTTELLAHLNSLGIKLWVDGADLGFSAPKGALTPALRKELVAQKPQVLALLKQAQSPGPSKTTPNQATEPETRFPLSHGQQALWFVYQNAPESVAYNMSLPLHIQDAVDVPRLRQALQILVERHLALRTTFSLGEGVPVQEVQTDFQFRLDEVDATAWTWDALQEAVQKAHQRPFDLVQGPVFRGTLFTHTAQSHVLLLSMHHLSGDAASFSILSDELLGLYAADPQDHLPSAKLLPPLQVSYADYVRTESELLSSAAGKRLRDYWQKQLAGEVPLLNLPTDYPRPAAQSYNGVSYSFPLSAELTKQLRALAQAEETTLFTILLAAYQVLLYRYTGQDDIWVGSPTAPGRSLPEFANTIGYLVNPVILRAKFSDDPNDLSFRSFLAQARQTVLGAVEHQDYPFPLLVQQLQPQRDSQHSPLFQTTYVLEGFRANPEQDAQKNLSTSLLEVHQLEGLTDLDFVVTEGTPLLCTFKYNTDLFEPSTIARMANHLQRLLTEIVADPTQRIDLLPLLSKAERHQLLVTWNDTQVSYSHGEACVHKLFEEQVERTPETIAVAFATLNGRQNEQLTYRELNQRANQLAHYLIQQGAGHETMIAISVERSLDMVVGLLAILKAGAAYVPLDPHYPKDRLAFMLEDMQATFLLTQAHLLEDLPEHQATVICLDRDWEQISAQATRSHINPEINVSAHDLAYMIYTSGSTGRPKGVLIEHKGIGNLAMAQIEAFQVEPESRVLQFASFSFDAAISEIIMALLAGATLVLAPQDDLMPGPGLTRLLQDEEITTVTLPPSALAILPAEEFPALKTIISAGETCSADIVTRWAKNRHFLNAYGPAECTVCATIGVCTAEEYADSHRIPSIGQPINNVHIYLLDSNQVPVPIGVPGEIYIGSIGMARGYHGRPELTGERFVTNPFASNALLYKSGDLARYLADGRIEFLGRMDHQVKIRGHRIELGEIESVLSNHPSVQETIVIARQNQRDETELVAYFVAREQDLVAATLRAYLIERLPDYMIPARFVPLGAMPLSPNGKVDRRALPSPDASHLTKQAFVPPQTATDVALADIWSETLQVTPIGMDDNFFELGGHSLLATRIVANIKKELGVELPINSLFQAPTIRSLTTLLAEKPPNQLWSPVVPIQPLGEKRPFFCIPGGAAHPISFWELARELGDDQPLYGLQMPGIEEDQKTIHHMDELVHFFLAALRQIQPKGPYLLGGHSSGGHIALALALVLEQQGEEVLAVIILDSIAPGVTVPATPIPGLDMSNPDDLTNRLVNMIRIIKAGLGEQFPISISYLQSLRGDDAWSYVLDAYKKARLLPPQAQVVQLKRMQDVYDSTSDVLDDFSPQGIYQGQLAFFQTSEIKFEHPEQMVAGWQALCIQPIDVCPIPGNHNSMLHAPHVETLAEKIGQKISDVSCGNEG